MAAVDSSSDVSFEDLDGSILKQVQEAIQRFVELSTGQIIEVEISKIVYK